MNTKPELIIAAAPLAVKSLLAFGFLAVASMAGGLHLANTGAVGKWKMVEAIADGVAGISFAVAAAALVMWLACWLQRRETDSHLAAESRRQSIDIRHRLSQGIMAGMAKAVLLFAAVLLVSLALTSLSGESFPQIRNFVEPVAAGLSVVSAVFLVIGSVSLLISWVQLRERTTTSGRKPEPHPCQEKRS